MLLNHILNNQISNTGYVSISLVCSTKTCCADCPSLNRHCIIAHFGRIFGPIVPYNYWNGISPHCLPLGMENKTPRFGLIHYLLI